MINSNFNSEDGYAKNQFDIGIDVEEECNVNEEANQVFNSGINGSTHFDVINIKERVNKRSKSWHFKTRPHGLLNKEMETDLHNYVTNATKISKRLTTNM